MKTGSRPQYYRIRRMVQMVREGADSGSLPNSTDFMNEFEISRRTVARDLDFLRDEERAPLAYDDARHGFRLTDETYTLSPVRISRKEAFSFGLARKLLAHYEGTPLHDGAAIIENGRIKAAGCVLPLSNNLDLGKDMGTRHRACLGIAENSDAIAIVVSEETGIISMAKNGVLIRHFDRQTLYTRLVDEMIPKETTTEKTTVSGWRGQLDRLWKWVSQKEDDAQ